MQAAAHNKEFAAKAHVPQKVAKEFADADQGGKLPERAGGKKAKAGRWYDGK